MTINENLGLIYRYRVSPPAGYDYISPVITAFLGYTPDDFYSDPDFDLKIVHPHDRERLTEIIANPTGSTTIRWICKDGSVAPLELTVIPVYEQESLVALEGTARVVPDQPGAAPDSRSNRRDEPAAFSLTERELQILALIIDGRSDREVGTSLNISRRTVEHHLAHIRVKTGAANTKAAIAIALGRGLIGAAGERMAPT